MSRQQHEEVAKTWFNALGHNNAEILGGEDVASNVSILKHYVGALQRGDAATMATILADDASYWILPGTTLSGTHDKPFFLKIVDKLVEVQSAPLQLEYDEITAQGDRVATVVRGYMPLKAARQL